MAATSELGVWAKGTFVDIAPRSSVTILADLLGRVAAGSTLRLSVRLLPSDNRERAHVVVTPLGPWNLASSGYSNWELGPAVLQERYSWSMRLGPQEAPTAGLGSFLTTAKNQL